MQRGWGAFMKAKLGITLWNRCREKSHPCVFLREVSESDSDPIQLWHVRRNLTNPARLGSPGRSWESSVFLTLPSLFLFCSAIGPSNTNHGAGHIVPGAEYTWNKKKRLSGWKKFQPRHFMRDGRWIWETGVCQCWRLFNKLIVILSESQVLQLASWGISMLEKLHDRSTIHHNPTNDGILP